MQQATRHTQEQKCVRDDEGNRLLDQWVEMEGYLATVAVAAWGGGLPKAGFKRKAIRTGRQLQVRQRLSEEDALTCQQRVRWECCQVFARWRGQARRQHEWLYGYPSREGCGGRAEKQTSERRFKGPAVLRREKKK